MLYRRGKYLALRLHDCGAAAARLDLRIVGVQSEKGRIKVDRTSGAKGNFGGFASGSSACGLYPAVPELG
jgi:hypothetical protein